MRNRHPFFFLLGFVLGVLVSFGEVWYLQRQNDKDAKAVCETSGGFYLAKPPVCAIIMGMQHQSIGRAL